MTLSKLVSLVSSESLYFACPSEFADPYEGFYPASHMQAFEKIAQKHDSRAARNQLASMFPHADLSNVDDAIEIQIVKMQKAAEDSRLKFGVNCWHQNDFESAAMWRLYSSSEPLIAIESTTTRLRDAITVTKKVTIDRVRYIDFEKDSIEKGHTHYGLFLKKKSFEYEREIRATLLLDKERKGQLVKCSLETLVRKIHISPFAQAYFGEAVRWVCAGISKPVCQSMLFSKPPTPMNLR